MNAARTTAGTLTVVLADDHPILCRALRQMLELESAFSVLGEAHDGQAALDLALAKKPDFLVLDVEMPGKDGLEVARTLQQEGTPTRVVFVTMHKSEEMFNAAVDAGAQGYVLKDTAHADIVLCLRQVASGSRFVSPGLTELLFRRTDRARGLRQERPGLDLLTASERLILRLIAQDKTTKEIADELEISPHTVANHRANICTKLDLRGTHSLLKFAYENKSAL